MPSASPIDIGRPLAGRLGAKPHASVAAGQPKSLSLRGVSKRFGSTTALHPTSLHVQPGELVSLLGPSGCGKTTTLRLIAGFEYADSGHVMIGDEDVSSLPPNKRGLGMVFQNYSLFPHMSVAENIAYGLRMAGVSAPERAQAAQRMLDTIRLPEHGARQVSQLSGGQQQRVALARAIVTNPSVLLLDEPLGALDKNLREGMQLEIRALQQRLGITSIMVTHDQDEAMTMSDRIVVMSEGRILQSGPPREVYDRPRTRFVAEFLGTANIFRCVVLQVAAGGVSVRFADMPQAPDFTLATGSEVPPMPGDVLDVAVRPEKIVIGGEPAGFLPLQGRVTSAVFRGAQHAYHVELPGWDGSICVSEQASRGRGTFGRGDAIALHVNPADFVALHAEDATALEHHA